VLNKSVRCAAGWFLLTVALTLPVVSVVPVLPLLSVHGVKVRDRQETSWFHVEAVTFATQDQTAN
jgi:hypothetical protein